MQKFLEKYRLHLTIVVVAGVSLLLGFQLAKKEPPVTTAQLQPETPAATTTAQAPATEPDKEEEKPAAPAPTKKPATKPAPTAPQSSPTPSAVGRTPTFVTDELKLSVAVSQYGADLTWGQSFKKDLKGYIIVKSTTDTNPYYPKQYWSLFRNVNTGNHSWTDRQIEKGKRTYYRACALTADDSVFCGNVVSALKP